LAPAIWRVGIRDDLRGIFHAGMQGGQGGFGFHFCFWLVDEAAEIFAASTLMTGQRGPFRHFGENFSP
jgi:hypothetical protein